MYLTFDVGTTSMKTAVFDDSLRMRFSHTAEYDLLYPGPDQVELDPETYWRALREGIAQVLQVGARAEDIRCVTITTQGETLIPLDRDGNPLHNAIVWLDNRGGKQADALNGKLAPDVFRRVTGMPDLGPATPVAKLMWLREERPELFARTAKFLLLEDYLIFRLTGETASEYALLSSTGYFDIRENRYWQEILDAAGIDRALLPTPLPCAAQAGRVTAQAAAACGLRAGTPVATGAMDQVASAVGAGNVRPGVITETTGTCLVLAATADHLGDACRNFSVYKHWDDHYLCLPFNPTAAIILKWFREQFMDSLERECAATGESVYRRMDVLAEQSPPGARGLILIPHFSGQLIPEFHPEARGVFYGVGLHSKREDFIRAILEGVGYLLRQNIQCLEAAGIPVDDIRSLGGGSRSGVWSQIKADICGRRLLPMEQSEAASLGAAILGAVAIGELRDAGEADGRLIRTLDPVAPNPANRELYEDGYRTYNRVSRALLMDLGLCPNPQTF